ncbi:hypothetical protein [Jannaschia donghaensis]|uniref:hypothetical protein n=1 Tax=Jannaschia donghaensis TaxID=420998 RepID=UPI0006D7BB86|nr:hypothetical protein [Jannaschia donghaensis]
MIFKIVTLFLIGIAVLAMFGRLRFPSGARIGSRKCRTCGVPRVGRGPCPCGKV